MSMIDAALAARNRQAVEAAKRNSRNAERRRVVALTDLASPVEPVRLGRDLEAGAWRDPEDTNPNRPVPRMVQGHRRVDHLLRLLRENIISERGLAAGQRFRDDYEVADGARPYSHRSEIRGGGYSEPGMAQLAALKRYREAVQAVGQTASGLLLYVCLGNGSLRGWAEPRGISVSVVTGRFLAGLDRLAEHYDPSADEIRNAGQ